MTTPTRSHSRASICLVPPDPDAIELAPHSSVPHRPAPIIPSRVDSQEGFRFPPQDPLEVSGTDEGMKKGGEQAGGEELWRYSGSGNMWRKSGLFYAAAKEEKGEGVRGDVKRKAVGGGKEQAEKKEEPTTPTKTSAQRRKERKRVKESTLVEPLRDDVERANVEVKELEEGLVGQEEGQAGERHKKWRCCCTVM